MSNNNKLRRIDKMINQGPPPNLAAQLTVTAWTDRPPTLQCTGDLVVGLKLMASACQMIANTLEQQAAVASAQTDPVDKKREFLGPRKG